MPSAQQAPPQQHMARQRAPHEDRQQQIVEAARRIITSQGTERLTVRTLAKEVGLSEAGIYRHVKSKRDILLMVLEEVERTLLETVARAQSAHISSLEKLQSILAAHLSYSERRRGVGFLVLNEALRRNDKGLPKRAGQVVEKYLSAIRAVLEEGKAQGEIRHDLNVEMAAKLFFGMVQSNVYLWALHAYRVPLVEGCGQLWEVYSRGIAKAG